MSNSQDNFLKLEAKEKQLSCIDYSNVQGQPDIRYKAACPQLKMVLRPTLVSSGKRVIKPKTLIYISIFFLASKGDKNILGSAWSCTS